METYKYEMNPGVVKYLLNAIEVQQIRGGQAAEDLLAVKNLLVNPVNSEELQKKQLEDLKAKLEPVTKEKKKK